MIIRPPHNKGRGVLATCRALLGRCGSVLREPRHQGRRKALWSGALLLLAACLGAQLLSWSFLRSPQYLFAEDELDKGGLAKVQAVLPARKSFDVCTVGAGLSGSVFAERYAKVLGQSVLVTDRRAHFGGNVYDYVDEETGVLMNKYGAHLFHTNDEKAWRYITMHEHAPKWERWDHEVKGWVDGKLVPIPVNINTVNRLLDLDIEEPAQMRDWLAKTQIPCAPGGCRNAAEMAKSRVGEALYEAIFKHYTVKQWNRDPEDLDALVTARIPVRDTFDPRYFSDRYQVLPSKGYTQFVAALLSHPNIDVSLGVDYFEHVDYFKARCGKIIYTGPIDRYFRNVGLDTLEYRGIDFVEERFMGIHGFVQPNSVVNYPGPEQKYTRVVEYKHFLHQLHTPHSITVAEYSKEMGPDDEPYYPVPNARNQVRRKSVMPRPTALCRS